MELRQYLSGSIFTEINHDISTKDHIEKTELRKGVEQIERSELNHPADLFDGTELRT